MIVNIPEEYTEDAFEATINKVTLCSGQHNWI